MNKTEQSCTIKWDSPHTYVQSYIMYKAMSKQANATCVVYPCASAT